MAVTLYTTQGEPFTVDDEDAPLIDRFSWMKGINRSRGKVTECGLCNYSCAGGQRLVLDLRKLIMAPSLQLGLRPHFIDGNYLRLEKANLAWLDAGTHIHRTSRLRNQHGFRGVRVTPEGKWIARVGQRGPACGRFGSVVEAAQAYDKAALKIYGVWARLNFPDPADPIPPGLYIPPFEGPLLGEDGKALHVDPQDLSLLSRHKWYPGSEGYWTPLSKCRWPLAALVMGPPGAAKRTLQFLDGDVRNCSRANLIWRSEGVSNYFGVYTHKDRWIVILYDHGLSRYFGLYDTPEEAAHAYDQAARETLGPRARLNFPQGHE